MAIYSLHHSHVGKSTQAQPGTAGAHVHYITRETALPWVMGENMPLDRDAARAWLDEREASDRKNGRVVDKLMVALPIELDAAQRVELVRDFMLEIGGGRVSWMAAVHDTRSARHNPHAHIILRDKDLDTGKRVIGTSEKGSTDRFREVWELAANRALERAGYDARIDRRSLEDQGMAREPGIHVGPNVVAMEERGLRPVSLAQELETGRVVNWPEIDQGRTRADRQREIVAGNLEREREKDKTGEVGTALLPPVGVDVPQPVLDLVMEQAPMTVSVPEALEPVSGGMEVAGTLPEATQRPSCEVAEVVPVAETPELARSKGRVASIITAAWSRLAELGDRLDAALERFKERTRSADIEVRPHRLLEPMEKGMGDNGAVIQEAMRQPEPPKKKRDLADELLAAARQRTPQPKPELDQGLNLFEDFRQGRRMRRPGEPSP